MQEDPEDEHVAEEQDGLGSRSNEKTDFTKDNAVHFTGREGKGAAREFPDTDEIGEAKSKIGNREDENGTFDENFGQATQQKHVDSSSETRARSPPNNSKLVLFLVLELVSQMRPELNVNRTDNFLGFIVLVLFWR